MTVSSLNEAAEPDAGEGLSAVLGLGTQKSRTILRFRLFTLLLSALVLTYTEMAAQGQARRVVNLELVLLVDVSASVDDQEFKLQSKGLAAAFVHPAVLNAIRSISRGGMAVSIVQWADHAHQERVIDWALISQEADAIRLAQRIASMQRRIDGGHTALGDALAFAMNEINNNSYSGLRRVIDLSGDGRSNDGRSLSRARKEVLENGITINGLAILNEIPLLGGYFRKHLIGGDAAFMMTAQDYSDFAYAIRRKLEQEIRSAPVASICAPNPPCKITATAQVVAN
jgi:Ca-activated chloride channel family protein